MPRPGEIILDLRRRALALEEPGIRIVHRTGPGREMLVAFVLPDAAGLYGHADAVRRQVAASLDVSTDPA